MAEDIGLIFGFGFTPYQRNHRADTCDSSADGGRYSRLDRLIDDDGPFRKGGEVGAAGIKETVSFSGDAGTHKMSKFLEDHPEDHKSTRKHFFVSAHSRSGGMGLHQGHREPKKQKEEKE